jgi:MoaA/NifB/PqqE/SkfB family radical SAM enzyme
MQADEASEIGLNNRFQRVLLLLTDKCNLECKHCYVGSSPRGAHGLSRERVLQLIDELTDEIGRIEFTLSGGEALVRRDDCFAILEHASKQHFTGLIANGTLITPKVAERLSELDIHLRISLDGSTAEVHDDMRGKGNFQKTLRGIDNLVNAGFPISRVVVGVTITPDRVNEFGPMLELGKSLGLRRMRFDAVNKIGRAKQFWPHIPTTQSDIDTDDFRSVVHKTFYPEHGDEWELEEVQSLLQFGQLNIYYDGSVYPYAPYNHPNEPESLIGNINETPLGEILDNPALPRAIMRKFLAFRLGPERSSRCFYVNRKNHSPVGVPTASLERGGRREGING